MMQLGLNEQTSVGRSGAYRPGIDHANAVQLTTCVARDVDFHAVDGGRIRWLGGPVVPDAYRRTALGRSWTGRVYRYEWDGAGFDAYLKTTLPGPLFAPHGRTLHWRWAVDNGVPTARALPEGSEFVCGAPHKNLGQVLLLNNWTMPTLVVTSAPIAKLCWVSHEHMTLEFTTARVRVLLVPLLDKNDVPREVTPWLKLIAAPPVGCQEEFEMRGDTVMIRQSFETLDGTPLVVPVPPVATFSPLQHQPPSQVLVKGLMGHYRVVDGASWETEIPMSWAQAKLRTTRAVDAAGLSPIPDELAYAGDVTWEPGSALDQLLALRVWSPLHGVCPVAVWSKLKPQLTPPTAAQLRASLAVFMEPVTGQTWAKEAKLFETAGDVAYDSDWYNGFELSGIWRATQCGDRDIAGAAKQLASEARTERRMLTNYYRLFHDWELGAAWTDARGVGWNCDCSHNGLEGLLAQAALCRAEGATDEADFAWYLAAKTANALLAAEWLVDYQLAIGFLHGLPAPAGEPTLGMNSINLNRGAVPDTTSRKNPYALAGNFPEFCALQKCHGRMDRYRAVAVTWATQHRQRYTDWIAFYCGVNPQLDATAMHSQEARVQAAVMYHLAPEVAFRLWTLDESAEEIERRFQTPLNLAEQLWCRAGATL